MASLWSVNARCFRTPIKYAGELHFLALCAMRHDGAYIGDCTWLSTHVAAANSRVIRRTRRCRLCAFGIYVLMLSDSRLLDSLHRLSTLRNFNVHLSFKISLAQRDNFDVKRS